MPHCVIEYSSELAERVAPSYLINIVFGTLLGTGLFKAEDIKVRAIRYPEYKSGGSEFDFIHATVHLLPGRKPEHKAAISKRILKALHAINLKGTMLSAVCNDIDESYHKVSIKT